MTGSLRHAPSGSAGRRSLPACCCQIRRRIGRHVSRRPPLRHLAAARAGRARRRTSRRGSAREPLATRVHAEAPRRAPGEPPRPDQGGAPRPAHARRPGEHLRRRGALACADPSAAAGAASSTPRARARCDGAIRRALEAGIARQGATLRDYSAARRRPRADAARVQGLRPRRRAVRPLRHADREDRASPAAAPGTARTASARQARPRAARRARPSRSRRHSSV